MLINAPISVGELLDKISILEIKLNQTSAAEQQKNINYEHRLLTHIRDNLCLSNNVYQLAAELKITNENIWRIENGKRSCEANKTFDNAFIQLSRELYIYNDKRGHIKKQINKIAGSEIVEEKMYTHYE